MLLARELTEKVIGLAIEVHRLTGPGMLESVYEGCLCHELAQAGIGFERQVRIPVVYKGVRFEEGFVPTFLWTGSWSLRSRRLRISCRCTRHRSSAICV